MILPASARWGAAKRIAPSQLPIRETSHSLIEIAMDVGCTSPSLFAQVFRRQLGMTPSQFLRDL